MLVYGYFDDQDMETGEFYDEDDRTWRVDLHVRPDRQYEPDCDARYSFDAEIGFEKTDTETFLEDLYPHWIDRFEEEYGETADLFYYPPENLID